MSERSSWSRLVAEAVLIVASILVAFAIDAAWDGHLDRIEERGILSDLRLEFVENRAALEAAVGVHRQAQSNVETLYSMTAQDVRGLSPDSVGLFFRAAGRFDTFNDRIGTLDGVIGAGKLGLVSDQELRRLLAEWRGALDDIDEEAAMLVRAAERVIYRVSELGMQELSADVLSSIAADGELEALVRAKAVIGSIYANDLAELIVLADQVIERLSATSPGI